MSPFPSYDFSLGMVLKPRKRCFNSWTSDGTTQMKRVQINSLFVFSYLPCPKHQALLPPFSITILGHLFKHKQQICLLVPMTLGCTLPCKPAQWMLMIQISTIKIVRPSGFSCHGLPRMLRTASPQLAAAALQPGTASPLHSQARTLPLAMARKCVPACTAPRKMKPNPGTAAVWEGGPWSSFVFHPVLAGYSSSLFMFTQE